MDRVSRFSSISALFGASVLLLTSFSAIPLSYLHCRKNQAHSYLNLYVKFSIAVAA
jgi:hypothetical protein